MKEGLIFLLLCASGLFLSTCSDNSSNLSDKQPSDSVVQIPGCSSHGLIRLSSSDTSFAWTFTDRLVIDFCLTGDCTPDSIRFATSHSISSDTIYVVSVDTATYNQKCICVFIIHGEFENLPLDYYVVICSRVDNGVETVSYNRDVYRNGTQ